MKPVRANEATSAEVAVPATNTAPGSTSSEWALRVDHLGKRYAMGEREQYHALRDVIAGSVSRVWRRDRAQRFEQAHRWALADVSFDVAPGEVVGIIGRNGAGKSTLLKLISMITRPTRGEIAVRGRVGTLLEVGSGFHPELTGAENIYLNGAILGMRHAEIRASFDEIVDFSGVAAFLDTPVKRYSTGMYMRLAFAVAAHLETEILVVDEVLAVGDAEFQRKCIGRMRDLSNSQGRTVLFVSHSEAAIRQLCPRSIWLDDGMVRMDGPSEQVMPAYLDEQFQHSVLEEWIDVSDRPRGGSGEARFEAVRLDVPGRPGARAIAPGDPLQITLRIDASEAVSCGSIMAYMSTLAGTKMVSAGSTAHEPSIELPRGESEITIDIEATNLNPGRYTLNLWMSRPTAAQRKYSLYDLVEHAIDVVIATSDDSDPPDGLVVTRSHITLAST